MRLLPLVLRWLVIGLAVVQGGYMILDGMAAIVSGDYIAPDSGRYAGRPGPWADVVTGVGLDPRGAAMKALFLVFGAAWLGVAFGLATRRRWAGPVGIGAAVATLWYLVAGTVVSVLVLVLLLLPPVRRESARGSVSAA